MHQKNIVTAKQVGVWHTGGRLIKLFTKLHSWHWPSEKTCCR